MADQLPELALLRAEDLQGALHAALTAVYATLPPGVIFFGMVMGEVESGEGRALACTASHNLTPNPGNADAMAHLANGLRGTADQMSPSVDTTMVSRPVRRRG